MPELPDVEVYRRYIESTSLHQPIERVRIDDASLVEHGSARSLQRRLKGRSFESTRRRGKHLFIELDRDGWLEVHFGMTGDVAYHEAGGDDPAYTAIRFDFENGASLCYVNRRKLGHVSLVDDPDAFIETEELGPDAYDLSREDFIDLMQSRKGMVKSALMDQSFIAGLGNVYVDETLFRATMHPRTRLESLDRKAVGRLHKAMNEVIDSAIRKKANPEKMPRSFLLPRREPGAARPRCGPPIETLKPGGRTTYFCPECQPAPESTPSAGSPADR